MKKKLLYKFLFYSFIVIVALVIKILLVNFKVPIAMVFVELFMTAFCFFLIFNIVFKINNTKKQEFEKERKELIDFYDIKIKHLESIINKNENTDNNNSQIMPAEVFGSFDNCNTIEELSDFILHNISKHFQTGWGIIYFLDESSHSYIVKSHVGIDNSIKLKSFSENESINWRAIDAKKPIEIEDIDSSYFKIESGTGSALPSKLYLLPIVIDNRVVGLIELASFLSINIHQLWEGINEYIVNNSILKIEYADKENI